MAKKFESSIAATRSFWHDLCTDEFQIVSGPCGPCGCGPLLATRRLVEGSTGRRCRRQWVEVLFAKSTVTKPCRATEFLHLSGRLDQGVAITISHASQLPRSVLPDHSLPGQLSPTFNCDHFACKQHQTRSVRLFTSILQASEKGCNCKVLRYQTTFSPCKHCLHCKLCTFWPDRIPVQNEHNLQSRTDRKPGQKLVCF